MTGAEQVGREGLALIDAVLAARPHKDDHKLSHATQALCDYRDHLIEAAGEGGGRSREHLMHLNAVLSVVAAMHFPLGDTPWGELEKARDWLADLVVAPAPA